MKRSEFLTELREDLAFELPERLVKENVDYYNNYISEEVRAGKSEQQVCWRIWEIPGSLPGL